MRGQLSGPRPQVVSGERVAIFLFPDTSLPYQRMVRCGAAISGDTQFPE